MSHDHSNPFAFLNYPLVILLGLFTLGIATLMVVVMSFMQLCWASKENRSMAIYWIARNIWTPVILFFTWTKIKAVGVEHIEQGGPFIFVPNHKSSFDFFAILYCVSSAVFAVKAKHARIPLIGNAIRGGAQIVLDVREGRSKLSALLTCLSTHPNLDYIVFSEGTRSKVGDFELDTFRPGAAVLAIESGRSIVPVSIAGASLILGPKKSIFHVRFGCEIIVEFGEPIVPTNLTSDDVEQLTNEVRSRVAEMLGRRKEHFRQAPRDDIHPRGHMDCQRDCSYHRRQCTICAPDE